MVNSAAMLIAIASQLMPSGSLKNLVGFLQSVLVLVSHTSMETSTTTMLRNLLLG